MRLEILFCSEVKLKSRNIHLVILDWPLPISSFSQSSSTTCFISSAYHLNFTCYVILRIYRTFVKNHVYCKHSLDSNSWRWPSPFFQKRGFFPVTRRPHIWKWKSENVEMCTSPGRGKQQGCVLSMDEFFPWTMCLRLAFPRCENLSAPFNSRPPNLSAI